MLKDSFEYRIRTRQGIMGMIAWIGFGLRLGTYCPSSWWDHNIIKSRALEFPFFSMVQEPVEINFNRSSSCPIMSEVLCSMSINSHCLDIVVRG